MRPDGLLLPGQRVAVRGGLPAEWGTGAPLGVVRAAGPVNYRVQMFYDGSEWPIRHADVHASEGLGPLVIVGCGAQKRDYRTLAGEMYTGPYHAAARRAARAINPRDYRHWIVSAKYGLLRLDDVIDPYEMRLNDKEAVTGAQLAVQARERKEAVQDRVVVLAGAAYARLCREVWPYAETPLAGTKGIGHQLRLLKAIADGDLKIEPFSCPA